MDNLFWRAKERVMQGKLSITKKYKDGTTEKLQEFKNIPVQGLGYSLARLFASKSDESKLDNFRFAYFQLGKDFVDYIPQGNYKNQFYQLALPLTQSEYGTDIESTLAVEQQLYTTEFTDISNLDVSAIDAPLIKIPPTRISRTGDSVVTIQIVIDDNMAINKTLQEVGLFIKNPDENLRTDKAILAAYKYFKPVLKTSQFSLIFDWVIQIVDTSVEEDWNVDITETHYPPTLAYLPIDLDGSSGTFLFSPVANQNIASGSYSYIAIDASGNDDTIDLTAMQPNGDFQIKLTALNRNWGNGIIQVRATPIDPFYGNGLLTTFPISLNYTSGTGSGGAGGTGGTGGTGGSGSSTGAVFKGPKIGDIDWVMPYTGNQYDYNTSQVVVLKAILPTNKASDFHSAPGLDKWMVVGGTSPFTTVSSIAQIEVVTRDPSGYPTNVEVIFSALAQRPILTPNDSTINIQTFGLYQASGSSPSSTLNLSSVSRLHFQIVDTSNNRYNCRFFTTTGGVVTFNPDSNPSIVSSLVKNGPFLKTYRFYGRSVPGGYGGGAGQWNANDPDHEVKPFGPSIHAYVTIRHNQEVANVDFRISNGHIHRPGYAGVTNDPIPYEAESSNTPGWTSADTAHVIGNFYYKTMVVAFGTDSSAISYIDKWDIAPTTTVGTYALVSAFPVNPKTAEQLVHCLPSMKALVHRFGVFKTANVSSTSFAKHETRGHYQAFPKIGNPGRPGYRNYQNYRAWGYHGDILPDFPDDIFVSTFIEEQNRYGENGASTDDKVGRAGQRRLCVNKFNLLNNVWNTGAALLIEPFLGFGTPYTSPKTKNCPLMYNDEQNGAAGGVGNITMSPGSRQMYEEYDSIEIRYESTVPRQEVMYNVSGNVLTLQEIVNEQNPAAITDASGYSSYYYQNPDEGKAVFGKSYIVNMGHWVRTSQGYTLVEFPSWFVRALSNSRRSQPGNPNYPNFNAFANIGNYCPYFFRATQNYVGGTYDGMSMFDFAHQERAMWSPYILAFGRNDPMAKEDLQNQAEFYCHAVSPYILAPYNKFTQDNSNILPNDSLNGLSIAIKAIRTTTPQFSGTGFNTFTARGTGLHTSLMVNYWTLADDTWRNNNKVFFDYATSGYAYGASRENGSLLDAVYEDYGYNIPDGNTLGGCLSNNNFYRRFDVSSDGELFTNFPGANKQWWYHNPNAVNSLVIPPDINQGLLNYIDTTNAPLIYGGTMSASSTVAQSFHEMYLKEGALALARLQMPSSSVVLKNVILSSISLGCSTAMASPIFGTISGVIGDMWWETLGIADLNSLGITPVQTNTLNYFFNTRLQDPVNREHGMAYWWPLGIHENLYNAGTYGYGSGIGQKRTYAVSDSGFAKEVAGQFYVYPDGGAAGHGRNRVDAWPIINYGMVATIDDSLINVTTSAASGTLASNYFIKKGPENLTNDFDFYTNPDTYPAFQNTDYDSLKARAKYGITNCLSKESGGRGMNYIAHYIAYLLKFMGRI